MRCALIGLVLVGTACGARSPHTTAGSVPRAACTDGEIWNGERCQRASEGEAALERGAAAVAAFEPDRAVRELEAARAAGPHRHESLVRLYEQLGIAHAYLGDETRAVEAFDHLLTLSPRHLLSYTLSPKVTFLFERVRRDRERPAPPAVDLSWPRALTVAEPVPVDIEIVADPKRQMVRATLEMRRKGEPSYRAVDLALAPPGSYQRVVLPELGGDRPDVLQLYLRAYDAAGNEVHRWGSADRPREVPLGYEHPVPWYRKWWVWAVAGSAVALGTGVTVYLIQREPPATVDGGLDVTR